MPLPDLEPQAGPIKILSYEHDIDSGVYRMVIGRDLIVPAHTMEFAATGEDGQPIYDEVPLVDENGNPVVDSHDVDGEEVSMPRTTPVLRTETKSFPERVVGQSGALDFVFDASDPRWFDDEGKRLSEDHVAKVQREEIKKALELHAARDASDAQPKVKAMPGIGEEL